MDQFSIFEKLLDAKLAPLIEKVEKIDLSINGNGKPGLCERVNALEDFKKQIMSKFMLVTGFFGLLFTAIWEIIKELIKGKLKL